MALTYEYSDYQTAADFIQSRITPQQPRTAIILGTGLGVLADHITEAAHIPYNEIAGWPTGSVSGHKGRLVVGALEGQSILAMQGRAHFYEGFSMANVAFPIRVMKMLGIQTLIVTNAAGGINTAFDAGDLMLIEDHINFLGMGGNNPLMGPNDERLGPRFPSMTDPYNRELRHLALDVAQKEGIALRRGVYAGLSGPFFETPAEVRMLRVLGADAVGMSTVSEVLAAIHAGIRVLGISGITNTTVDAIDLDETIDHSKVLEVGARMTPNLVRLVRGILRELAAD